MEGSELPPPSEAIMLVKTVGEDLPSMHSLHVPLCPDEIGSKIMGMVYSDSSSFGSESYNASKESQKSIKQLTIPEKVSCRTYKHEAFAGKPLAHVLSIIINPVTKECKLNGNIWVVDDKGIVDNIFMLDPEDSKLISFGSSDNSLFLCQSNRAILATTYFQVHFDLKDGDCEFIKGSFSWDASSGDHDKVCEETICGKHGSAKMSYIVHSLAIEGHIMATFKKSQNVSSSIHVAGTMAARYKNMMYDFDPSDDGSLEYIEVKFFEDCALEMDDKDIFPLEKSVVAIPLYYPLVIEVDVRKDSEGEGNEGGQVLWNEKVEFSIWEIMHYIDKDIEGPFGCINLRLFGVNYGQSPFSILEEKRAFWRGSGLIYDRWTYPDWVK